VHEAAHALFPAESETQIDPVVQQLAAHGIAHCAAPSPEVPASGLLLTCVVDEHAINDSDMSVTPSKSTFILLSPSGAASIGRQQVSYI
jgi:hypothetical protein